MLARNGHPCQIFSELLTKKSFYHMKLGMASKNAILIKLQPKKVCLYFIIILIIMLISFYLGNGSSSSSDSAGNDYCEACHKHDNEDTLLLCDGCNRGFHTYYLNPPLSSVPKTDWFCSQCITTVKRDYGFQLGNKYSPNDFYTVCNNFKANWFQKTHPQGTSIVTEDDCEREFWRLMSGSKETRLVKCGVNLHER